MPATLSLTLGTPAAFGAFTPGVGKDYPPSTTATVISTAGDATLTVADPSTTATGHLVNGAFSLQPAAAGAGLARRRPPARSRRRRLAARPRWRRWTNPVSNDPVTIGFKQTILASERAAHGRLREDAHVHALDDATVIDASPRPLRFDLGRYTGRQSQALYTPALLHSEPGRETQWPTACTA